MFTPAAALPAVTCTIEAVAAGEGAPGPPLVVGVVGGGVLEDGGELVVPPQPISSKQSRKTRRVRYTGPLLSCRLEMNT